MGKMIFEMRMRIIIIVVFELVITARAALSGTKIRVIA
jgi:hypothetical protein